MVNAKTRLRRLTDPDGRHYLVREETPARPNFGVSFFIMFMDVLDEASNLTGTQLRVLVRLPRHLDFKAFKALPREKLAAELSLSGSAVSNSLVALQQAGMIERKGSGPVTQWRLALKLGWRGSAPAYHKAKRERAEGKKPSLRIVASTETPPAA
jgi:DNA-binding transcriptional ArsR family regulator